MIAKTLALIAVGALPLALAACEEHHHPEEPVETVSYEPVPQGYVYSNDPYYYRGRYDNDYWTWRDEKGHFHREARVEHERHEHEHPDYDRH